MRKIFAIAFTLLLLPAAGMVGIEGNDGNGNNLIYEGGESVYIKAGDDFYIHFNESNGIEFGERNFTLNEVEKKALLSSPPWIRSRLARQFELIDNATLYANLILSSPPELRDEIAFSIATSPINAMPSPSVLYDNAEFIYKNAEYLKYAHLIEFENGSTTIGYTTLDNGKEEYIICPLSIYYWYVVHPRITFEDAERVYGKFWREYLFYHNDIGYPLLMEKLNGIKYVWDNKTYYPPPHRTWKWSMENHPTAIEAINYWVGKTVNQLATGDRPGQPNIIAHEHNGFCGELQQISVAAQRSALIPSVGICDLGEDHVWREFWIGEWHECDNWWADGGGCVANYSEYRYRWGKIISALFGWNGDSSIYDVTPKYIRREDMGRVEVEVVDAFGKPVDGARVIVFGSWKANNFKNRLWGKTIGRIWEMLPEELKEKWEEKYERAWKFYRERVPGLIPWVWPSIWNYTDVDGKCSFNLGLGHSYMFMITKDDILYYGPFTIGKSNSIHYYITLFSNRSRYMKIRFILPDRRRILEEPETERGHGKYNFSISFKSNTLQLQRNPWDWKKGFSKVNSKIKFFVVDEENFRRYKEGLPFNAMKYFYSKDGSISFNASNCYMVFKNDAKRSDIILNFHIRVRGKGNFIYIVEPDFEMVNAGNVKIKGFSTGWGEIEIDGERWDVNGEFEINWHANPGEHIIHARCGDFEKSYAINCYDVSPPSINIEELCKDCYESLHIKGWISDNYGIKEVKAIVDDIEISLGKKFDVNVTLPPGDYILTIVATDLSSNTAIENVSFTIGGIEEKPIINEVFFTPTNPSNESNIVVYANVTKTFYKIKNVTLIINGEERKMYEYASHPAQPRHPEDALRNESNSPIYGIELSQMEKGNYVFRIKAVDTAGNIALSEEYTIQVN